MRQRVIGPRGGESTEDVSCDTCICGVKCGFAGTNTRPWGCSSWVDEGGQRPKEIPRIEREPDIMTGEKMPDIMTGEKMPDIMTGEKMPDIMTGEKMQVNIVAGLPEEEHHD
jgi:hypothetical protein